jgi:glycosyltransferase involved in cell wall biosynthesis
MLTYNREAMVGRAIESVLNQTFNEFEYIIIDNGSTDQSGIIADEYAKKDRRISIIHRKKGNIGSGSNAGLDAANGDYIAFIDDDDWCEPDFLEFLNNLVIENNADVSICGATDKVFDKKLIMTPEDALIELMLRKHYNTAFPTKLIKRDLYKKFRFPEDGKYDDIALMYRLLALAKRIAYHGLPKYTFYRHQSNNSAWTTNHSLLTPETLDEYLRVYRERTVWLSKLFPNSAAAFRYFEWSFMLSMIEKINRLGIKNCEKQLMEMARALIENHEEFEQSLYLQIFEQEWMRQYIKIALII